MSVSMFVHEADCLEKLSCEGLDIVRRVPHIFVFLYDIIKGRSKLFED